MKAELVDQLGSEAESGRGQRGDSPTTQGQPAARAAGSASTRAADVVDLAERSRLAHTMPAWQAEILAWHATEGCSNVPTEAVTC